MLSVAGLKSLAQRIQFSDPRLYDLLIGIIGRLAAQDVDLNSIKRDLSEEDIQVPPEALPNVTSFNYTVNPDNVLLYWERPVGVQNFELRKGVEWDSATRVLITNTTTALLNPLTLGQHTYLIKAIDADGNYSPSAARIDIIIPQIPAVSISSSVVDNNVLLYWSVPSSAFRISYYIIKRNGIEIGTKDGTFTTVFEQVAGDYTYSIIPVDVAGNQGLEAFHTVRVTQPPDYVLQDIRESTFAGFKINCMIDEGDKLLFGVENQTWDEHFSSRGWNSIQDQISAGYPYFAQPSPATCIYEESGVYTIDYGAVFSGVMVNLSWAYQTITGNGHNITAQMRVSPDNVNWGSWVVGKSIYFTNFRYLQIHIDAVAIN